MLFKEGFRSTAWKGWNDKMSYDESINLLEKNIDSIKVYQLKDIITSLSINNFFGENALLANIYNPTNFPLYFYLKADFYDEDNYLIHSAANMADAQL